MIIQTDSWLCERWLNHQLDQSLTHVTHIFIDNFIRHTCRDSYSFMTQFLGRWFSFDHQWIHRFLNHFLAIHGTFPPAACLLPGSCHDVVGRDSRSGLGPHRLFPRQVQGRAIHWLADEASFWVDLNYLNQRPKPRLARCIIPFNGRIIKWYIVIYIESLLRARFLSITYDGDRWRYTWDIGGM